MRLRNQYEHRLFPIIQEIELCIALIRSELNGRLEERKGSMNESILYENVAEQRRHLAAVETVARDLHRSTESINSLYEFVLTRYKRTARIKDYLAPLVIKRVKELLRNNALPPDKEGRRSHSAEL
jgi:hypothetical protein